MIRNWWHNNDSVMKLANLPYSGEMLPAVFRSFPKPIELFDRSGDCIFSNCRSSEGIEVSDAVTPFNLKSDVRITRSEVYPLIKRAYEGGSTVFHSKPGYNSIFPWYKSDRLYEISVFPVLEESKTGRTIALMHTEIGELPKIKSKEEESKVDEIRNFITSFLSNISHEFRTPLSWVLGYSDLISQEENLGRIREHNKLIGKGGHLLLSLVDNLIETSSAFRESSVNHISLFDLNKLLIEVAGLIGNEISQLAKAIEIRIKNETELQNAVLESDRNKLMQILLNLLHNAVKFTSEGYIEIGARQDKPGTLLFYVRDTGIGIEKSKQDYIFDLHTNRPVLERLESFGSGLGLGLLISRDFVEKLGGRIWVESEPGKGACFFFTISADLIPNV